MVPIERRQVIVWLRYVVIASAAYMVLANRHDLGNEALWFVALFAASNVALAAAPNWIFNIPQFGPVLILADTALILYGLSWGPGLTQDLILVYFFIVFLTTVGESLASIAIGSALVITLYGTWLATSSPDGPSSEAWLRVPFFFLIAIFFAFLTEQLKFERKRREVAENETGHLRLLLDLAGTFSETHATREFVRSLGGFVERVCPGVSCEIQHAAPQQDDSRYRFALHAHGRDYGTLAIRLPPGRELDEREYCFCQMVAHSAAGSLYSAEQSNAARSAAELKDQFLATISHELRTPLHAILGYIEIVEMTLAPSDHSMHDIIARLRLNACRMQDLVEQVLGFAEVRAGYRACERERIDMGQLLDELAPLTRELLGGKPVGFIREVAADARFLFSDRRKLRQVLVCLLSNAAKFTESGEVRVQVSATGDQSVAIRVIDTGVGIAPSDLAIVFEDFRQADGSLTRRYGGLGIGLPFARELVGMLGGSLDLSSQPARGTEVCVVLPEASATRELHGDARETAVVQRAGLNAALTA